MREKQGKLCLLHKYVQCPIEIGHSEEENLVIYSFSLWCSLTDTAKKYVAPKPYSDTVGILHKMYCRQVGAPVSL